MGGGEWGRRRRRTRRGEVSPPRTGSKRGSGETQQTEPSLGELQCRPAGDCSKLSCLFSNTLRLGIERLSALHKVKNELVHDNMNVKVLDSTHFFWSVTEVLLCTQTV